MHDFRFILFMLITVVLCPPLALANPLSIDPLRRSQDLIQAFKTIKPQTSDQSLHQKIDPFIDFNYLSQTAIKPHRDKFTDQQATVFQTLFTQLIRLIAYPETGTFFNENPLTYGEAVSKNNFTIIPLNVLVKEEDLDMELGFYWHQRDNQWVLADLSIDDDSLIKDYQNQFGRIINKASVANLLKKLQDKITEFQQTK